jgi:hypothetical protein
MFSPPKVPPLVSLSLLFKTSIRRRTVGPYRRAPVQASIPKKGPTKGKKYQDPNDPTKTISRAKLINFRARGPTTIRSSEKSMQYTPGEGLICSGT